jgi:hypothetical protein
VEWRKKLLKLLNSSNVELQVEENIQKMLDLSMYITSNWKLSKILLKVLNSSNVDLPVVENVTENVEFI